MIEDGEVDLDPGWDTAPLPPIEPILERDLPVDLALSGVMGVPEELFRPGRAGKENEGFLIHEGPPRGPSEGKLTACHYSEAGLTQL